MRPRAAALAAAAHPLCDGDASSVWPRAASADLKNEQRLVDTGLSSGDHTWIDVGDGTVPSEVRSRTLRERPTGVDVDERPGEPLLAFERCSSNGAPNPDAITVC
jgi:hypothetical protein